MTDKFDAILIHIVRFYNRPFNFKDINIVKGSLVASNIRFTAKMVVLNKVMFSSVNI